MLRGSLGAAWKRKDRFKRTYIYVQIGEGQYRRTFRLFPNVEKRATHQPDYVVVSDQDQPASG